MTHEDDAIPHTTPAAKVAQATDAAVVKQTPMVHLMQAGLSGSLLSRWWTLRSKLTGKYVMDGNHVTDDGHFDWHGAVLIFFSKEDAERRAVSVRNEHPLLQIEVVPLPSAPPDVVNQVRHNDGEPIAAVFHVTRAHEDITVELRPETLSHSLTLLTLLGEIVELAAQRIAGARVSPLRLITVGPVAAQIDIRSLPNVPADGQEAA